MSGGVKGGDDVGGGTIIHRNPPNTVVSRSSSNAEIIKKIPKKTRWRKQNTVDGSKKKKKSFPEIWGCAENLSKGGGDGSGKKPAKEQPVYQNGRNKSVHPLDGGGG